MVVSGTDCSAEGEEMKESQKILVAGNQAAEITVDWNPLFINIDELNKLLEGFSNSLAQAIADGMNRDEAKGAE